MYDTKKRTTLLIHSFFLSVSCVCSAWVPEHTRSLFLSYVREVLLKISLNLFVDSTHPQSQVFLLFLNETLTCVDVAALLRLYLFTAAKWFWSNAIHQYDPILALKPVFVKITKQICV